MPRRSLWKGIFVDAFLTRMKQNKDGVLPPGKKIWSRRSSILPDFVDWSVRIYNGKTFVRRKISENMVGHKFGEFANTKKRKPHKSSNMASDDGESDDDDELQKDLEALKRACYLTGTDSSAMVPASFSDNEDEDENCDEDLNLIRDLQKRFAMVTADDYTDLEPLCSILPGDKSTGEDFEDDLETLRAIQRRFAAYGADGEFDSPDHGDTASLEHLETANNLVKSFNAEEDHSNVGLETAYETVKSSSAEEDLSYLGLENTNDLVKSHNAEEDWGYVERTSNSLGYNKGDPDSSDAAGLPIKGSSFPKAASAFVDAIKQNRSCQKLIRSKLMHVESRIEELKELKARVKILKDFQVACTRRTGRALSQKKDVRAQLISMSKINDSSKLNEKKASPMLYGPIENPQVSKFREVVEKSPTLMDRAKWSKEENERLANGLKQLFQEMLLQRSLGLISDGEGIVDGIVESISDVDVTPDKLRQFLPKVNWNYLASIYVPDRSGAECQTRWLNWEDPLINKNPWTPREDKTILHAIQKGLRNWIDIAMSLGTNRTPFQCLARYQRSLNASMLKREWTEEDDNQLRAAVETYGESNWQIVASVMEGRTGTQCSNRWLKTLHPARQRIGRWTVDEDKRLKVAATFFGPKNWKKIAKFVPGRTQVQCRERWVNSVDPTLNLNTWTEEEDSKLQEAIEKYGYCWSKVAACVPPRTDSQCRRRWKVLLPDQVPLLRAAREVQKVALISNFVDRESERPALYPNDFVPSRAIICVPESESVNPPKKRNRGLRQRRGDAIANSSSGYQYSMAASGLLSGTEGGTVTNNVATKKKRKEKNSKKTKSGRQDGGSDLVHSNSIAYSDVNTVFGCTSDERAKEPFFGQEEGAFDWVESNLYPFSDVNTSLIPVSEAVLEMNRDEESAKQVSGLYMNNGCTYKQRDEGGDSGITKQPQPSPTFTSLLMTSYMEEFDQLDTNFGEGDKVDIDDRTESFHIEQRDEGEDFGITEQPHPSPTFTCLLMTPYMEEFEQLDTNFGDVDKVDIDDRTESFHTELLPSGFEFNNQQSGKTGDVDDVFVQKGKWEAKPRRSFVRGCKTKMRSRKSAQIVSEDAVDDDSTLAAFCQERSAVNDDKGTAVAKNEEDDVPLAPFCKKRFAVAEIEDDNSTLAAFCKKISASFNKKRTAVAETGEDMPASFCKKRFAVADSGEDDDETLASFCSKLMRKKRRVG